MRFFRGKNDQDFDFHISAEYNFDKRIWTSSWFEIERNWWKDSKINVYKYPILNDHMFLYNNYIKITNITGDLKDCKDKCRSRWNKPENNLDNVNKFPSKDFFANSILTFFNSPVWMNQMSFGSRQTGQHTGKGL